MDGWAIAFWSVFGVIGLAIIVGIVYKKFVSFAASKVGVDLGPSRTAAETAQAELKTKITEVIKSLLGGIGNIAGTISLLLSDFVFLAGPLVDMFNQSYKYSIASIVGIVNTLLLGFFGSHKFAEISKSFIGIFGFPDADPARSWEDWISSTWWRIGLYLLPLIISVFTSAGTLAVSNLVASQVAYGFGFLVLIVYVFIPLAGSGYLELATKASSAAPSAPTDDMTPPPPIPIFPTGSTIPPPPDPSTLPIPSGPVAPLPPRRPRGTPRRPVSGTTGTLSSIAEGGGYVKAGPDPEGYCELPGFGWAEGGIAPASVILSQTILWCHIIEMIATSNNKFYTTLTFSILVFIAQGLTLWSKGCLGNYKSGKFAPVIGAAISIAVAGLAYVGLMFANEGFTSDEKGSSGIFHNPPTPSKPKKSDAEKASTKIVVGPPEDTSEPVDDQDAFVCEAYRDGELITSTIVE